MAINKTTPAPGFDTASNVSSEKHRIAEKQRVSKLLKSHYKENRLIWTCRRIFCGMGCCMMALIFVLVSIIAYAIWATTFTVGFETTKAVLNNYYLETRNHIEEKLYNEIVFPMEILEQQRTTYYTLDIKFDNPNATELNTLSESTFRQIENYRNTFPGLFYGTEENNFVQMAPSGNSNFSFTFGTYATEESLSITYNESYQEIHREYTFDYGFKPTERPWYQECVQHNSPLISSVYLFYGTEDPGVTYTIPIHDNVTGEVQAVLAADYNLKMLSGLLTSVKVGNTGSAFLVEKSGNLLASSKDIRLANGGNRIHALDNEDEEQRLAAKLIDADIGFANLGSEFQGTIGGNDVLVLELKPSLRSSGESILIEPWYLVLYFASQRDYMKAITWANVISSILGLTVLIIACLLSFVVVSCVFVIPLNILISDMTKIRTMDLERIPKRWLMPIYELRELQKSFYTTIDFLRMYKSFLPSYLLEDEEEQAEIVESDTEENASITMSQTSTSRMSFGSSQRTKKSSKTSAVYQKAVSKLKRFEIGIEHGEGTCLVVNLLFSREVLTASPKDFVEQHSRFASTIESALRIHSGSLDRFSEYKFVATFFEIRKAVNAAADLRKKLDAVVSQFKNTFSQHIDFCIGLCSGDISVAVLGTQKTKTKRVFGVAVEKSEQLSQLGDEWPTKIIIDRNTARRIDRKKWMMRPVTVSKNPSEGTIFEVFCTTMVKSNEWLYEKHDQNKLDAISVYKKAFNCMENEKLDEALSLFKSFLEIHEDDPLTLRHVANIEKMKSE